MLSLGQFVDKNPFSWTWQSYHVLAFRSKFSPNLSISKLVRIRNLFQKIQENFVLVVKSYFTRYFLHFLIIGTFIEKLSLWFKSKNVFQIGTFLQIGTLIRKCRVHVGMPILLQEMILGESGDSGMTNYIPRGMGSWKTAIGTSGNRFPRASLATYLEFSFLLPCVHLLC